MSLDNPKNRIEPTTESQDGWAMLAAAAYQPEATGTRLNQFSPSRTKEQLPLSDVRGTQGQAAGTNAETMLCKAAAQPEPTQEYIQQQLDSNRDNTLYKGTDGRWCVTEQFRQDVGRYVLDGPANGWSVVGRGEAERRERAEDMINQKFGLTGSDAIHLDVSRGDFNRPKVNFIQRGRFTQTIF